MKRNFASTAPTQNFYNDVKIKKKVVSKFGKKTAYSSSSWSNSPRYIGFETLHLLLEGVKKIIFPSKL